jgi:oxaloacetate decarboxylase gamma subunit
MNAAEVLLAKGAMMTPSELLLEGVELMLFGIGFVFLFLLLLVLVIRVMSRMVELFASNTPVAAVLPPVARHAADAPSAELLVAIQSAINQHRARRG